ncbi:hypothetical protein LA2_05855 [Lactobacillus amylovorus GRL 1112]|uniref:Uncharacterized protein n=1 Tax=Lactobacillus amylovorus (strain GRL 1112) TaxID=695560 RepID=E4SIY1_LACAR|nr:hypothetical protein [Lactobacillus amylovorus]ADQ59130.1 hypothetical protein LA2_05855 [Lactobacillus amylovorus GRL 1112]
MAYETTDQLIAEISDHWVKDPRGNMYKLLDTYNTGFEQISDIADKVERWRAIQDAEGTTLDLFGQDINTSRPTKEDDPYRFLIKLKVLLSRAQGTIPSIVHITSTALGTDKGIKIWHTAAPRHIGIRLPWDYVNDDYIQRFLVNNLQHMLALGYWLDCIVFRSDSPLPLYIGVGSQDKTHEIERSKTIWWTGWKARTPENLHVGIYTQQKEKRHQRSKIVWWDGWKARAPAPAFLGSVGRIVRTQVWHSSTLWREKQEQEVHAGLTIGSKTITQATQSLTTE